MFHRSRLSLNLPAFINILSILVTPDISQAPTSELNEYAFSKIPSIPFTFETSHPEKSGSDIELYNILCIFVRLEVCQILKF